MATVDTSTLAVRIKVIGKRELDKLSRSFTRLGDVARGYGNRIESTLDASNGKWKKHFDFVDKMVKGMGMALTKFVGMSAKIATVQVAALGAAMMAVHAAFVLGNGAMKAFRGIAQLSAGAVAGLTIALSAAAAAMREQQAAMFAYRGVGKSAFGSGLNQVRVELRGLMTDADLAAVGAENLMGAFTAISQKGVYTQGTQRLFKGLMDFASAGQDIKTGSKAAGELVATLIDPKANFSQISEAAKALGPTMVQALEEAKKKGIDTADELKAAILDGSLAIMGGVEGQFNAFNSTLINQFKKAFAFMKEVFADFGQPFLEPLKFELAEVEAIMRSTFMRITGDVSSFAQNNFIGNISVVVEKLANFLVATLANHWLAALVGEWVRSALGPDALRWLVGLSFLAVAAWTLVPDRLDEDEARPRRGGGVFMVTVVAFFIAEMGDKTQVATVLLAARFDALAQVVAGTTLGMLVANVPAVLAGHLAAPRLPLGWIRGTAAVLFAALGLYVLYGFGASS